MLSKTLDFIVRNGEHMNSGTNSGKVSGVNSGVNSGGLPRNISDPVPVCLADYIDLPMPPVVSRCFLWSPDAPLVVSNCFLWSLVASIVSRCFLWSAVASRSLPLPPVVSRCLPWSSVASNVLPLRPVICLPMVEYRSLYNGLF